MDNPTAFPVRVQYTKEFLADNAKIKQRQGVAKGITRGYERVVTIIWDESKAVGYVHLDFLEEVKTNPTK